MPLLPTTVVGSYPQPEWLVDRSALESRLPPRVRARELWRIPEEHLEEAQDAATLVAIRDMERAGVDIVTDGEIRRESYSNRFATALSGIDVEHPGTAIDRTGHPNPVPRIAGPIRHVRPVEVRDAELLVRNTTRLTKITLPGPFTMMQQAQNDHYGSADAAAMDYADAVNAEIRALFAAGVDMVQLDEPYVQARPTQAREYAVRAIDRALDGITGTTVVHLCFGYAHIVHDRPTGYSFLPELDACSADVISIEAAQPRLDLSILRELPSKTIMLGVIDLGDPSVETPETVAARIRRALEVVPPERLWIAPDCGMKYLARDVAFGKLQSMVRGTALVRAELGAV
ncbi:MAG: cobalamin-independent methionine synthase II family protein [Deltaproteobacteria bacterium]|nr:cobalamin-independent methionine synthase II family protein [Deltaproteobacteria bacterium]